MVNTNMRHMFYAVGISVLMLLMVLSTTIISATNSGRNAITFDDLSEENEKTIYTIDSNVFNLFFGFIIVDAVISEVIPVPEANYYVFMCEPVQKVTVIGQDAYLESPYNKRFFIKSFTNVSVLIGITFKELEESEDYQHFFVVIKSQFPCELVFT
jgi:hypothetical protein